MGQTKRFGHTDVAMAGTRMCPATDPARDTAVPRMVAVVDVDRGEAEDEEADIMTRKVKRMVVRYCYYETHTTDKLDPWGLLVAALVPWSYELTGCPQMEPE
jgi:hypothetical protein